MALSTNVKSLIGELIKAHFDGTLDDDYSPKVKELFKQKDVMEYRARLAIEDRVNPMTRERIASAIA